MTHRMLVRTFRPLLAAGAALVAAAGLAGSLAGSPIALDDVAFMTGSWCSPDGRTEEHWIAPKGGLMLGVHRSVDADRTSFEYLRIELRDGGVFYVASPQGGPATAFAAVEASPGRVLFANPEHDFPTRIRYEAGAAGELVASIEGEVGGETRRRSWSWQRCP